MSSSPNPGDPLLASALPPDAHADRVRLLYGGVLPGALGGVAVPLALAWMLRGHAPARWLLAWIAAQALAHGALLGVARWRAWHPEPDAEIWLRRFRGCAFAIGLAWSILPLALFPASLLHQLLVTCVLVASAGVVLAKLVPDMPSALLFLAPSGIALTARLVGSAHPMMHGVAALAAAYFIVLGLAMRSTSAAFDTNARMRALNARLADYNAFLGQVHRTIALARDEADLLQTICALAVRYAGARLAWIGRPDAQGSVHFVGKAGPALDVLDEAELRVDAGGDASAAAPGSVAQAWREQRALFNVSRPPAAQPWLRRAAAQRLDSSAVLPIRRHDAPWALLALYSAQPDLFDTALQRVLLDLADSVSHGLDVIEARRWTETLSEHSEAGVALVRQRRVVSANRRFARMFGYETVDTVVGMATRDLYHDAQTYDAVGAHHARLSDGETVRLQSVLFRRRDGSALPCDLTGARIDDEQSIWTFVDVKRRDEEHRQLLQLERLYRALLGEADVLLQARTEQLMLEQTCARLGGEAIFHAAWIGRPDADGRVQVLARAGPGAGALDHMAIDIDDPRSLVARAWREGVVVHLNEAQRRASPWAAELERHQWGSALAVPVQRGDARWAVLAFVSLDDTAFDVKTIEVCTRVAALLGHALDELDLKQRISQLQAEEAHRARHDVLTGLPNRRALEQYLPQAIARAARGGTALALGMIDLDDFKPINDRHGHEAGDALLRELGLRLQRLLRATDFVARLGGDEFVVVLEQLDRVQHLAELDASLRRLHRAVETPLDLGGGRRAEVGMSMGVALYPIDDAEPDALMRRADAAMYRAKADKIERDSWWSVSGDTPRNAPQEAPFNAFGDAATLLLGAVHAGLASVRRQFIDDFYAELKGHDETAAVLASLSPDELLRLHGAQAQHLDFLLDPATDAAAIVARARHLGEVHALIGVSPSWLTRATNVYHDLLQRHVDRSTLAARERYHTLRAADARLQLDLHTELDAMQAVADAYSAHAARALPSADVSWASQVQAELDALGALPGVRACQLLRPRDDGAFAVEFSGGTAAAAMERVALTAGLTPQLDSRQRSGQGLIPLAWHSEQIQHSDSYALDERTQVWHEPLAVLGIRSIVAIPVLGVHGPEFVLAIEGAFPHQFSNRWARDLCLALQNRWGQIARLAQPGAAAPLTVTQATEFRRLFHSGALCMEMQPVVDLREGRLVKLEALARLRRTDGAIIAPGQFLPSLRDSDLDALFRQGLEIALGWQRAWRERGLDVELALNLAPSTLVHADCAAWVDDALRRHDIAPQRLTLELLENQEFNEGRRDEAIAALRRVGVRLAIDDLGSGYSSLKRLASLNFDVIKADQSLVRDVASDPVKTLSLVRTIVQIGRDFDREVVVEGLETAPLIEAVMRLGASQGQGWGLSRPMPPEAVMAWAAQWHWRTTPDAGIGSYLGALAYHWRYMHEDVGRFPLQHDACPLTGFLDARGHRDDEAARWHRAVHEAPDPAPRRAASRQLLAWLAAKVRVEAAHEADAE